MFQRSNRNYNTIKNTERNGKYVSKGWNRFAVHFKHMNIVRLVEETQEDQKGSGWRRNNI
jgi:hypothetical protein